MLRTLALAAAIASPAAAQDLESAAQRALGLSGCSVQKIDPIGAPTTGVTAQIWLDGLPALIQLEEHSVRAPGFELIEQHADGSLVSVDPGPVVTLRGTVEGAPETKVAAGLLVTGLHARLMMPDGREFWIQPLPKTIAGAGSMHHVVYERSQILRSNHRCGADLLANNHSLPTPDLAPGGAAPQGGTLYTAELGCDADFEFYQDYGSSTSTASNRIQTVINTMNLQYEPEVGITHSITTTLVRTSSNQPYTSSDAGTLLTQFRSEWNSNQTSIQRDVAQLFTGKSIIGGTIGIAWVGAVCTSFGFGMVESDFNGNFASATDLSAHELGHNWNADHCSCTSYTMNPFITSSNTFNPQGTRPTITSFRNSRSCLSTGGGGGGNPPGSAGNPSPSNNAGNVSATADLSWSSASGATSYAVYFGTDSTPDPGELLGTQSGTSRALGTLAYSTTYYWRIDPVNSNGTTTGTVWSFTTESQPPGGVPNDSCSTASAIGLGSTGYDTTNATLSPEAWNCASGGGPDIWYSYVAGSNADLRVDTCGSGYDTAIEVYLGSCSNLSLLACNDDSCGLQSQIDITGIPAGTAFTIRVGGWNGATGSGAISITETSSPPPGTPGSPQPSNGALAVSVDQDLAWSAGSGATSYDVYLGTSPAVGLSSGDFQGNQSGLTRDVGTLQFGTTYYWRIDSVNNGGTTTGNVWTFTTEGSPVPNDDCTDAEIIGLGTYGYDTSSATNGGPAWTCAGGGGPDVWFSYTATSAADLRFDTCGTGYDTALQVFIGGCSGSLIACNDDACGLQSTIDVTGSAAGTTFLVRVGGYNGATGAGDLTVTETSPPPPGVATNPLPSNGATNISVDQDLSWTAASGAATYDVYLGLNPALGLFLGDFQGNQSGTSRDVGTLEYATTYYWRIDSLGLGGVTIGDVWSFTTEDPPPPMETLLFRDGFNQGSLGVGWTSPDLRKIRLRSGSAINGLFARIRRAQYIEVTVDASTYTGLRLESARRARNYDAGESFQIIVNGTAVETLTGSTGWVTSDIDLGAFAGQSAVTVRFKSNGSALSESGDIDQIRIIGLN